MHKSSLVHARLSISHLFRRPRRLGWQSARYGHSLRHPLRALGSQSLIRLLLLPFHHAALFEVFDLRTQQKISAPSINLSIFFATLPQPAVSSSPKPAPHPTPTTSHQPPLRHLSEAKAEENHPPNSPHTPSPSPSPSPRIPAPRRPIP